MKTIFVAAATAIVLGVAPMSSAMAFERSSSSSTLTPYDVETTGSLGVHDGRSFDRCPMSSAAEGNANQQTFPVKQYGQTAGGYRC